jgi:4-amino-4-deoxy-L-arabinose transferase-like glycosyltransferase
VKALAARRAAVPLPSVIRSPLLALGAITLAAGLLRLWALRNALANPYYDAAVRSMSGSLHNFFYGAYEPGGGTAIDKPPVALWLQVLSVKLLGLNPRGLIAPQALASTASVPLLYGLVRRAFGTGAGLAAAAALAVLPISVVTARSDTMDSVATALSVAAAWLTVRAAQTGRVRTLVAAGAVCGLAFEVKLFEGLLVLPALALLYWLAAPRSRGRRARDLGMATVALVVVAMAWPVAVSLTPSAQRPYPIGSTDGTVWSSIFYYNGTQRLAGPRYTHRPHGTETRGAHVRARPRPALNPIPPGPGRLLDRKGGLATLVGVELLGAILLGALALAGRAWREDPPTEPPRLRLAVAAAIACWLVLSTVLFSKVEVLHPRYLEAMGPPVAAALGVGLAGVARLVRRGVRWRMVAAAALLGICAYALPVDPGSAAVGWAAAAVGAVGLLAGGRDRTAAAALALVAVALLAAPTGAALDQVSANVSVSGQLGSMSPRRLARLSAYLSPRTRGARWEVAVADYIEASALVVHDDRPVLVLASTSSRPVVSVARLRAAVRRNQLRYAIVGGSCGRARGVRHKRCLPTVRWIREHGVDVTRDAHINAPGLLFRLRSGGLTGSQHGIRPH